MAIQVTCPGCLKRFSVSEKFAGKSGPCPSCSKPIKIPELTDQVVIHGPAEGPADSKGRPIFKPIRRKDFKLSKLAMIGIAVGTVVVLAIALAVRFSGSEPPVPLLVLGSILLAPPLVMAGYTFLRDDELEGYTGQELLVRGGITSLVFALTWGLYALIPTYLHGYESIAEIAALDLVIMIPIMVAIGMFASVAAMELEFYQGAMHYLSYIIVTFVLALIMGTKIASPFAGDAGAKTRAPAAPTAPANSGKSDGEKKAPIKVFQ